LAAKILALTGADLICDEGLLLFTDPVDYDKMKMTNKLEIGLIPLIREGRNSLGGQTQ